MAGTLRTNTVKFLSGSTLVVQDANGNTRATFDSGNGRLLMGSGWWVEAGSIRLGDATHRVTFGGSAAAAIHGSATSTIEYRSAVADGASAVAHRISAHNDLTIAGGKILSLGDAAGSTFVEQALVDYKGMGEFSKAFGGVGGVRVGQLASGGIGIEMYGGQCSLTRDGSTGALRVSGNSATASALILGQTAAKPAASSSLRGALYFERGGSGVDDVLYVCRKNAADAYEWVALH